VLLHIKTANGHQFAAPFIAQPRRTRRLTQDRWAAVILDLEPFAVRRQEFIGPDRKRRHCVSACGPNRDLADIILAGGKREGENSRGQSAQCCGAQILHARNGSTHAQAPAPSRKAMKFFTSTEVSFRAAVSSRMALMTSSCAAIAAHSPIR